MNNLQRENVVAVALSLIRRGGVRSFRVDELAHQLGISKRTLYENFKDKEDIIRLASQLFFEMELKEYRRIERGADNFMEALLRVMDYMSQSAGDAWRLREDLKRYHHQLFCELVSMVMRQRASIMVAKLKVGVRQGYIRENLDLNLAITALQSLGKVISENRDDIVKGSALDYDEAIRQVMINYTRGLCTLKGIEIIDNYKKR